ncbi:DUF4118 domain-containing protein [Paludibacterium yongneupense]|uniref:DUF4118 domain-containing protein n=1 Tax=Paludibacterium yongneupense TaxID=400061 RepID=UPI00048AE1EC|nr:DUF4118 domain-containing protein [Paludibacterium yongneupense]
MKIKNASCWAEVGAKPYFVALAGLLLAFLARYMMQAVLGEHALMLFFAINCTAVAFFYGFKPSFVILLISLPLGPFSFLPPYFSLSGVTASDLYRFGGYFVGQILISMLFESLHRTRYEAELLARVAAARYQLLVESDEDRRSAINGSRSKDTWCPE